MKQRGNRLSQGRGKPKRRANNPRHVSRQESVKTENDEVTSIGKIGDVYYVGERKKIIYEAEKHRRSGGEELNPCCRRPET